MVFPNLSMLSLRDKVLSAFLAVLAVCLVVLSIAYFSLDSEHEKLKRDYKVLEGEKQIEVMQKNALHQALLDQSEAIEQERVKLEEKLEWFNDKAKQLKKHYEDEREKILGLTGNEECEAMRELVRESVR